MRRLTAALVVLLLLAACSSAPKRTQEQIEASSKAYAELGWGYFTQDQRVQAIENLQKALEIYPDSVLANHNIALVYQKYGRPKLAEKHFNRAIELDRVNGNIRNNFGNFLYIQKKYQEAEQQYLKAIEDVKYDTPSYAMENAAFSALGQKDKIKAETYFRRALEMNPKRPRSLLEMARLSLEKNKYLNVRAWISRFEEVSKHTPQSLWLAIQAEKQLKDRTAVTRHSIYLKNNFPDSREAKMLAESEPGS